MPSTRTINNKEQENYREKKNNILLFIGRGSEKNSIRGFKERKKKKKKLEKERTEARDF